MKNHISILLLSFVNCLAVGSLEAGPNAIPVRTLQEQNANCTFDDFVSLDCRIGDYCIHRINTDLLPGGAIECRGNVELQWSVSIDYAGRERCFDNASDTSEGNQYNENRFNAETGYCMTTEVIEMFGVGAAMESVETIIRITRPPSRQGTIRQIQRVTPCDVPNPDIIRGSYSFCTNSCPDEYTINNETCLPECLTCDEDQGLPAIDCSNVNRYLVQDCGTPFLGRILDFFEGVKRLKRPPNLPEDIASPAPVDNGGEPTESPIAVGRTDSPTSEEPAESTNTSEPVESASEPPAIPTTPTMPPVNPTSPGTPTSGNIPSFVIRPPNLPEDIASPAPVDNGGEPTESPIAVGRTDSPTSEEPAESTNTSEPVESASEPPAIPTTPTMPPVNPTSPGTPTSGNIPSFVIRSLWVGLMTLPILL